MLLTSLEWNKKFQKFCRKKKLTVDVCASLATFLLISAYSHTSRKRTPVGTKHNCPLTEVSASQRLKNQTAIGVACDRQCFILVHVNFLLARKIYLPLKSLLEVPGEVKGAKHLPQPGYFLFSPGRSWRLFSKWVPVSAYERCPLRVK